MSDAIRPQDLKEQVDELKIKVSACEDCGDSVSGRVVKLEYWRDGNGAKGAEERLQAVEEGVKIMIGGTAITKEQIDLIGESAAFHIVRSARDKDKTTISKVKAFAPIVVAIITTAGMILIALL